jgi:glutaredoxin
MREPTGVEVQVYGKTDCGKCEAAKKKTAFFIEKWGLRDRVPVTFIDMDTVEGRAEGAFRDVAKVPTILVLDGETETGRWEEELRDSGDLRRALGLTP